MALIGFQNPFFIEWIFKVYPPTVMRMIPIVPDISGTSLNIRNDVRMRKRGVKARKGMVNERGEALIALMERIMAVISRGSRSRMVSQKVWSSLGISINGSSAIRYGMAKRCLSQVTRYSSVLARDFLVRASVVAEKRDDSSA